MDQNQYANIKYRYRFRSASGWSVAVENVLAGDRGAADPSTADTVSFTGPLSAVTVAAGPNAGNFSSREFYEQRHSNRLVTAAGRNGNVVKEQDIDFAGRPAVKAATSSADGRLLNYAFYVADGEYLYTFAVTPPGASGELSGTAAAQAQALLDSAVFG